MIYVVESSNQIVVRNNFDIIEKAARVLDTVKILNDKEYLKEKYTNKSIIITGALSHAFRLLLKGKKNICVWVQGIIPEESFLRRKSKIRFKILNYIEKYTLKRISFVMLVSNEMKKHYEEKYKIYLSNHIVFPCFNTNINLSSFDINNKYNNNVFVYAGGTAKWQNLDAIVEAYSLVESKVANAKFLFLVNDEKYAKDLVAKYHINNYEIKYVSKDLLPLELSKAKFGFVLREDNAINNVSTPTKLSTYLSCGVIPIFTESIRDFYKLMKDREFRIIYNRNNFIDDVKKYEFVDRERIKMEFISIFNDYYSNELYISEISKKIGELL